MSKTNKPTKNKLLELLTKNGFNKQGVAQALAVDEKSVRRWCLGYEIDVEYEKKKTLIQHKPVDVRVKSRTKDTAIVVTPQGEESRRVFVFSDYQIPYYNRKGHLIATARCKDYLNDKSFKGQPYVIIIGDFQDYNPLIGKDKLRQPHIAPDELKALDLEFMESAKVLAEIEAVLPMNCIKIFMKGNHEDRADKLILKPNGDVWKPLIDIDDRLGLTEAGWKVFKYNDNYKIGHLYYTHGSFHGKNHAAQHAQSYAKNVMYGHTHQIQVFTQQSPVRELPVWAASIGCLADVNPEWQRNRPNAHELAFAEVSYIGDDFFPAIHRIIRNTLVVPGGKTYRA